MVLCAMVGYENRSPKDKENSYYYRLSSVKSTRGQAEASRVANKDKERGHQVKHQFVNIRVCSDHFITGTPAKL